MNLGAISTLVFDLDGVVWRGDAPIESAITAINELRAAGKRCLYCTNNSSQTQAAFVAKLQGMGVKEVVEEDIITSAVATATYLSAQFTGQFLAYVVGGEGIRLALQKIGARIVPDSDITEETNVDCVIAGIDRQFNYEKLNTAQRLIRRGALFVATNRDATYPTEDGVVPGSGAIVSAIETAGGSTPVTVGKPRPVMLQLVMQQYNLQPHEVAFIGDRLDTDIVCARRAGVAALLVTTGVTTLEEARRAKGEMRPDAVFPDLTTFTEVLLGAPPTAAPETAAPAPGPSDADVVPESTPLVEEAASEIPEVVPEPEIIPQETVPETDSQPATAADDAPDLLAGSASADEVVTEGWDDSWFAEAEKGAESDEIVALPGGDEVVIIEENGGAETTATQEASENRDDESKSTPASGSFDWKLD